MFWSTKLKKILWQKKCISFLKIQPNICNSSPEFILAKENYFFRPMWKEKTQENCTLGLKYVSKSTVSSAFVWDVQTPHFENASRRMCRLGQTLSGPDFECTHWPRFFSCEKENATQCAGQMFSDLPQLRWYRLRLRLRNHSQDINSLCEVTCFCYPSIPTWIHIDHTSHFTCSCEKNLQFSAQTEWAPRFHAKTIFGRPNTSRIGWDVQVWMFCEE